MIEPILTDCTGFHMDRTNGATLVTKLGRLMETEAVEGDFNKFINDWSAERIIDDLDARIGTLGRTRVRRLAAAFISNRIITAFFAVTSGEFGTGIECAKAALNLLEAGNRKWAHRPIGDRVRLAARTANATSTCPVTPLQTPLRATSSSDRKCEMLD